MEASRLYTVLATLLLYGLIIAGFLLFGDSFEEKYLYLYIIVSCLAATQFVQYAFVPLISTKDKAHKDVGILGIKMLTLNIYAVLAIVMIAVCIYFEWGFTIQVFVHAGLLLMLVAGYAAAHTAGGMVTRVHAREQNKKQAKRLMRNSMDMLLDKAVLVPELAPDLLNRLEKMQEALRYLSPSDKPEAEEQDNMFMQKVDELSMLIDSAPQDSNRIGSEITILERIYTRRKQY